MADVIDDPHGLYYERDNQPGLHCLGKEVRNLSRSRHGITRSLRRLERLIKDEILKEKKEPEAWYLTGCCVMCYGPFRHKIGLVGDTIQILIAHDPSVVSNEDVLFGLHRCQGLDKLSSQNGQYNCSVQVCDSNLIIEEHGMKRWLLKGFKWTLECYIQIVSLPEVARHELSFHDIGETYSISNARQDVSEMPDAHKQALLGLHLERYLYTYADWCYETSGITLLLRKMVEARGLRRYLPPIILHLLAFRYAKQASEVKASYYRSGVYGVERSDLNLAKHICKTLSEYDFENMGWHVDGDKPAPGGTCLRIMHPLYPELQINRSLPPNKTDLVRQKLRKASEGRTISEFLGRKVFIVEETPEIYYPES
jgi:hypothetical protein